MTAAASWRWADISGDEHEIGYRELWNALSAGSLPPYVLVWRPGFREWMHAQNVAELADALGVDRAAPPSVVFPDPTATSPPVPPLGRYKNVAPPGAETLLSGAASSAAPSVPAFVQKATRASDQRSPPAVPTPPPMANVPIPVRDVQPTLTEVEPPQPRTTLRPAGAMPPPPRRVPVRPPPVAPRPSHSDAPPAPKELNLPPPPPPPAPVALPVPPPPVAAPVPAATRRAAPPQSLGGLTRSTLSTITAVGLVIPGLTLLVFALTHDPPGRKRPQPEAASASAATPPAPPPLAGCVVEARATSVSASAFVSIPVLVAATPDGSRAAIGFGTAKDRAAGITVDPKSLATEQVFQAASGGAILGVVPLVRSGKLEFAVDPPPVKLTFARTIDAPKRFSIGVSDEGLARAVGTTVDVIWPGKSDKPVITIPRVATAPGGGHVVTFRHGGQEGKVLAGRLNDDGTKQSELRAVGTEGSLVGTPAVAVNENGGLVAFSAKGTAADPWHLELARFTADGLPERGAPFAVPAGGPGGEAISPAVEGLDRGRFLLQWTEGSAGNRAVRIQVLAADLVPIGDPITLSGTDQNAGQGALWVRDARGLALFLVKKDQSHELWGASLRCR